jgi:peptide/nickel transport system ATP-binding protein
MGTESNAATLAEPLLAVRDLVVERPGLRIVVDALDACPGAVTAVLGPSGSGKSSLLAALIGHRHPGEDLEVAGCVEFDGGPIPTPGSSAWRAWLRGPVAAIPQDARAALDPLQPIGRQIAELAGVDEPSAVSTLARLRGADAASVARRLPHEVSGGEAQSGLLAVALARPGLRLCLLDEPSAGLDAERVEALAVAVRSLGAAGVAVLLATHDVGFAARLDACALHLDGDGRLCAGWPPRPAFPSAPPVDAAAPVVLAAHALGVVVRGRPLLESASLAVRAGESLAVRGPSGAGKTTLARALVGRIESSTGHVERHGRVLLLDQDAAGSLTPHRTVASLCAESAAPGFDIEREAKSLGLEGAALASTVGALSGGQRRRAALLRALAARPAALILDEPTAGLDRVAAVQVVETLLDVQRRHGLALLWITHDEDLAAAVSGQATVHIQRGRTC